jgi:hypothetical protein
VPCFAGALQAGLDSRSWSKTMLVVDVSRLRSLFLISPVTCHKNLTRLSFYIHQFDMKLTPWVIIVITTLLELFGYP